MIRPHVLMLGWEFPPIVNGGLGVACYGLTKALAKYTDITLILPKSSSAYVADNVKILAAEKAFSHATESSSIESATKVGYEAFADVSFVEANLMPYGKIDSKTHTVMHRSAGESVAITREEVIKVLSRVEELQIDDLYGGDLISNVVKFANISSQISEHKHFDVIHAHDWMTFLAGMLIKARTGKPLVVHVHATEVDRSGPDNKGAIYQIEKKGMDEADVVVAVSNYTKSVLMQHYSIPEHKIKVVHNGIEPAEPVAKAKKGKDSVVMFLGRLAAQKGPEYFMETAEKVLEKIPNVRFVMAGTGDMMKSLIEERAAKKIGTKFHFTGFLDENKKKDLFAVADVYCMPSVSEPFGLSALEAAQQGIPSIISNRSGVAEVLPGALKTDFWDTDLTAMHIIDLLQNPKLRATVIESTAKDVENLTWDRAAANVSYAYRKLMP